jgi:hypothetical protein
MLSQLSNKQLFWANYFEGIQYMLVIPIVTSIYFLSSSKFVGLRILSIAAFIGFTITLGTLFVNDIHAQTEPLSNGTLKRHIVVINSIKELSGSKPICLRIYTPPVIPHTYNYLFDYYERGGYPKPSNLYLNNECYYIFEKDEAGYEFRTDQWRKENIPATAKRSLQKNVTNNVYIERWSDPAKK